MRFGGFFENVVVCDLKEKRQELGLDKDSVKRRARYHLSCKITYHVRLTFESPTISSFGFLQTVFMGSSK